MARYKTYLTRDCAERGKVGLRLLALPSADRLRRLLLTMLDEREFLSPYGIRSMSAVYGKQPYVFECAGAGHIVRYVPGESDTAMFGGNSNWRGPVWYPINYLICESLRTYDSFYGESFQVECPTGSGKYCTLGQVADEIENRLVSIFTPSQKWATSLLWGRNSIRRASQLAGPDSVPRILPRRQWPRARCEPPNRLDQSSNQSLGEPRRPPSRRHAPHVARIILAA